MPKLAEVLKSIALQSGVSETEFKSVLDNPALASIEVADDVSTKLIAPRLSMDAAKNNHDLKKHFTALALNGVDAELERTATEMGISVDDLKALDSTSKRIGHLTKAIQEAESKKSGSKGADTEKLTKQIEALNADILKERNDKIAELKAKDDSLETERTDWTANGILSNFEYATAVDKDINVTVAKALINKELQSKGLKVTRKDNVLSLLTAEGTEYFENNAKVGYQDFATKVVANAKLLKASNSTPPAKGTPTRTQSTQTGKGFDNADAIIAELESKS